MGNTESTEVEGVVTEPLPNMLFRVALADGQDVLAHVSTEARLSFVKLLPGDRVRVALSTIDPGRGRITYRYK
jgi:translation initiation factor IF-1